MAKIHTESEVIPITIITQETALRLNKEFGVKFGEDGIYHTGRKSGHKKYYLYTTDRNLRLLAKLQK